MGELQGKVVYCCCICMHRQQDPVYFSLLFVKIYLCVSTILVMIRLLYTHPSKICILVHAVYNCHYIIKFSSRT
jgi:hypothetical protein